MIYVRCDPFFLFTVQDQNSDIQNVYKNVVFMHGICMTIESGQKVTNLDFRVSIPHKVADRKPLKFSF